MTNVEGGDGGAGLSVAEEVALRKTCARETTEERQDSVGGSESYLLTRRRSETERDCSASAYQRTYYVEAKTENENA